jgi:hypothetical protein
MPQPRLLTDLPGHGQSIPAWHIDVDEKHVWPELAGGLQRIESIRLRGDHKLTGSLQGSLKEFADHRLIVDTQDSRF